MRWTRPDVVLASVIALTSTCVLSPGHRCEDDAQCLLADEGQCEAEGVCSYPDSDCVSKRRYGKWAPEEFAGICVPESSSSTDSTDGPPVDPPERIHTCGNGVMDPGEGCEGGGPSACNPRLCLKPGTVVWEQIYDGPGDDSDRGHTLVVDAAGESFYVAGIVVTDPIHGADVVVQRRSIATGELEWTWTKSHSDLADEARHLAVTADGSLVVVGTVVSPDDGDDVWMAKFEPDRLGLAADHEPTWELVHDHAGTDDRAQGVAITQDGSLVGVGYTRSRGQDDALFVRVDGDGAVVASTAIDISEGGGSDRLHGVVADGNDLLVTGLVGVAGDGAYNVYIARYDHDFVERSLGDIDEPNSGSANRGISIAMAHDGAVAVAGSYTDDRSVWRYADPTTLTGFDSKRWESDLHDEATGIAFAPDGSFVVCGVLDFAQGGTPDDESDDESEWWVALQQPDTEIRWDTHEIPIADAPGTDRALGVIVVDGMAIVTGYRVTDAATGGKAIRIVAYAL